MTTWAHCLHEARHAVAVWAMVDGRRVDGVSVGIHANEEGVMRSSRVSGGLGIGDLVVSLCGWIGDEDLPPDAVWPEPWPVREDAPEGVGYIVRKLGLNEEAYRAVCELAIELCEAPEFQEAVTLVARELMIAPKLDHQGLELLREQTAFADEPEVVSA